MSTTDPFAGADTTPVQLVKRERETAEAMLVTRENRKALAAWVASKSERWFIHDRSWGNPGIGLADGGNELAHTCAPDYGDLLIWGGYTFYASKPGQLLGQWRPGTEPELTEPDTDALMAEVMQLRARCGRTSEDAPAREITTASLRFHLDRIERALRRQPTTSDVVTGETALAYLSDHHNGTTIRARIYRLAQPSGFAKALFDAWLCSDYIEHERLTATYPAAGAIIDAWKAGGLDAAWRYWDSIDPKETTNVG